jgi:serine/threonine protein kinase
MNTSEPGPSAPAKSLDASDEAWLKIKLKAASRYREGEADLTTQSDSPEASGDETIPDRVARIKARVTELLSDISSQQLGQRALNDLETPADNMHIQSPTTATTFLSPRQGLPIVLDDIASQTREDGLRQAVSVAFPTEDRLEPPMHNFIFANPKLSYILSTLGDKSTLETFITHGISDLWLPISKQTARKLFPNSKSDGYFLQLQKSVLDAEIHALPNDLAVSNNDLRHSTIGDDEDIVTEHRVLGEGAYGIVEEVSIPWQQGTMRCVRKRMGRPNPLKAQKRILAAFAREISVMRQVNYQHCARFLGSYTDFDHVNILSSPIADMDLAMFLDQPIGVEERKFLYRGVGCLCNAINYLHQNNIRHEDLKPQNVLIHGENILLTDFGFSLDFSSDSISTTTGRPSAWTIRYSAPEVLEFEPRNRATDIYSLGCILLEMISGLYGISLRELKDHWKHTGSGQSSFARNPEAVKAWFREHLQHGSDMLRIKHLGYLLQLMLNQHRLYRPTAQQVVDRLIDISILVPDFSQYYTCPCKAPAACFGLANTRETENILRPMAAQMKGIHNLAEFLYPWNFEGWTYELWDLDFQNIIANDSASGFGSLTWYINDLRNVCNRIYQGACRTGATAEFWKSHYRQDRRLLSDDGKEQARISAHLLSSNHVVYTRIVMLSNAWNPLESEGQFNEWGQVQLTLLPVCIPRSSCHGCFFWMLSWSTREIDFTDEDGVIDLTISG